MLTCRKYLEDNNKKEIIITKLEEEIISVKKLRKQMYISPDYEDGALTYLNYAIDIIKDN